MRGRELYSVPSLFYIAFVLYQRDHEKRDFLYLGYLRKYFCLEFGDKWVGLGSIKLDWSESCNVIDTTCSCMVSGREISKFYAKDVGTLKIVKCKYGHVVRDLIIHLIYTADYRWLYFVQNIM